MGALVSVHESLSRDRVFVDCAQDKDASVRDEMAIIRDQAGGLPQCLVRTTASENICWPELDFCRNVFIYVILLYDAALCTKCKLITSERTATRPWYWRRRSFIDRAVTFGSWDSPGWKRGITVQHPSIITGRSSRSPALLKRCRINFRLREVA